MILFGHDGVEVLWGWLWDEFGMSLEFGLFFCGIPSLEDRGEVDEKICNLLGTTVWNI